MQMVPHKPWRDCRTVLFRGVGGVFFKILRTRCFVTGCVARLRYRCILRVVSDANLIEYIYLTSSVVEINSFPW